MRTEFETIGGHCLVYFLGRGGMGEVWAAVRPHTESPYALKVLQPEYADQPDYREMWRREAAIGAQLGRYASIVGVHDFGEDTGVDEHDRVVTLLYTIMDFVDGVNLHKLLHELRKADGERLGLRLVVHVVRVLLRAVHAAHTHRIGKAEATVIHGDIKPSNLLVSSHGDVPVTDFGIARFASASS